MLYTVTGVNSYWLEASYTNNIKTCDFYILFISLKEIGGISFNSHQGSKAQTESHLHQSWLWWLLIFLMTDHVHRPAIMVKQTLQLLSATESIPRKSLLTTMGCWDGPPVGSVTPRQASQAGCLSSQEAQRQLNRKVMTTLTYLQPPCRDVWKEKWAQPFTF